MCEIELEKRLKLAVKEGPYLKFNPSPYVWRVAKHENYQKDDEFSVKIIEDVTVQLALHI